MSGQHRDPAGRRARSPQTDGPYAEGKEVAGGYAIIEVRSHEEAVENARRVIELHLEHWPGWEGSVEIRQMFSSPG